MSKCSAWISKRVSAIAISAIKEMAMRSADVEDAALLTWGVPSFQTRGRAFGPAGKHHVRMAFCVEDAVIEKAFDRIEENFGH